MYFRGHTRTMPALEKTKGHRLTRKLRREHDALRQEHYRNGIGADVIAVWFRAADPAWETDAARLGWRGLLTLRADEAPSPGFFARAIALRDAITRPLAAALWSLDRDRSDLENWRMAQTMLLPKE